MRADSYTEQDNANLIQPVLIKPIWWEILLTHRYWQSIAYSIGEGFLPAVIALQQLATGLGLSTTNTMLGLTTLSYAAVTSSAYGLYHFFTHNDKDVGESSTDYGDVVPYGEDSPSNHQEARL